VEYFDGGRWAGSRAFQRSRGDARGGFGASASTRSRERR
jgi:hypothetical protein